MCGRQRAFYRSPVTQVAFVLTGLYMAYAFSPWGPTEWRKTPSLQQLHRGVPWPALVAAFLIYVALILAGSRSITAGALGAYFGLLLYLVGFAAMIWTLHLSHKSNPFALTGIILACVLHFGAARLATYQRERL